MPWAELPAYDASVTEISHFITDVARTLEGYYTRNYAMGYDKAKKAALWAAYPLHAFYTQAGASAERKYAPIRRSEPPSRWSVASALRTTRAIRYPTPTAR